MKDRLLRLLAEEKMTSMKLAEIMEVQPSNISHILSGRNNPGFDFIARLLRRFPEINPDWLLNGDGGMYRSDNLWGINPIAWTPQQQQAAEDLIQAAEHAAEAAAQVEEAAQAAIEAAAQAEQTPIEAADQIPPTPEAPEQSDDTTPEVDPQAAPQATPVALQQVQADNSSQTPQEQPQQPQTPQEQPLQSQTPQEQLLQSQTPQPASEIAQQAVPEIAQQPTPEPQAPNEPQLAAPINPQPTMLQESPQAAPQDLGREPSPRRVAIFYDDNTFEWYNYKSR